MSKVLEAPSRGDIEAAQVFIGDQPYNSEEIRRASARFDARQSLIKLSGGCLHSANGCGALRGSVASFRLRRFVVLPTVSLDVISLVASSCRYYKGQIAHRSCA